MLFAYFHLKEKSKSFTFSALHTVKVNTIFCEFLKYSFQPTRNSIINNDTIHTHDVLLFCMTFKAIHNGGCDHCLHLVMTSHPVSLLLMPYCVKVQELVDHNFLLPA